MKKVSIISLFVCLCAGSANAYEYNNGRFGAKLNGYGTFGIIEPKFINPSSVGDWRVRGQMNYAISSGQTVGAVYAIDALAIDEHKGAREAFLFTENARLGRLELGMTNSIATKLAVGLPDVGGMRLNDYPIFYKKIAPENNIISNTAPSSGRYDLRANIVSVPTRPIQYGVSIAGLSNHYKYATDFGLKYRRPDGKTKTAFSFGASYMESLDNFNSDIYAAPVTADWRGQISTGMNLQYNSWIWGLSARAIYDRNPIGIRSDGAIFGTGVSYDLLKYTVSLSYLLSDTGIWDNATPDYVAHTVIGSFRYKYTENVDSWISIGLTTGTPFVSAGIRATF